MKAFSMQNHQVSLKKSLHTWHFLTLIFQKTEIHSVNPILCHDMRNMNFFFKSQHFLKIKPTFDEVCCLVSKVGKLLNSSLIVFNILESSTYSMRKEKSSAINHFSGYTHLLIYVLYQYFPYRLTSMYILRYKIYIQLCCFCTFFGHF